MPTRNASTAGFSPAARTEAREIGVGMLGYGYMGRIHSEAYRRIAAASPPLLPRLVAICGRTPGRLAAAARAYGFERHEADWRAIVADERVGLFDNGGPNSLHAEPTIAAAEAGKHVVCEKPLGRTADESHEIWRRAAAAGVVHMCAFNYRFVPAVRRARELVRGGDLGEIFHVRARYLQEWLVDPEAPVDWRLRAETAGSGAVADLGVHVIDLVRFVVSEPRAVAATTRTYISERPGGSVDVDDAFAATLELEGGAIGTLEASRVCRGRGDDLRIEVNGSRGSLAFVLARPSELRVAGPPAADAYRTVPVPDPRGDAVQWKDTFVYELSHLLQAIGGERSVEPAGATFEDGYRAAEVCDAILRSAESGRRERVTYRDVAPG